MIAFRSKEDAKKNIIQTVYIAISFNYRCIRIDSNTTVIETSHNLFAKRRNVRIVEKNYTPCKYFVYVNNNIYSLLKLLRRLEFLFFLSRNQGPSAGEGKSVRFIR